VDTVGKAISRRGFLGAGAGGVALTAFGGSGPAAASVPPTAPVTDASPTASTTAESGSIKEYWIQVDSFSHNLVPTGLDQMMGMRFRPTDATFGALGYRAYSPHWGAPLVGDDNIGPNTGIPGPVIRAAVGDTVLVHFRNNDRRHRWPHSMHPHGFSYTPANDGGYVEAQKNVPGRAVAYGESYTYTWVAQPNSVGTWPYHDHSVAQGLTKAGPVMEFNAELGMFGLIAITDASTPPVDREFFLFFHDLYQADVPSLSQDFDCFNGRSYLGNTPTFTATVGQRIRWRVAALGKEFHVFHIHGHRWADEAGRFTDAQIMGPSTTLTVEYTEDNPGDWLYHCHVTDHMAGGMVGWYKVDSA
jgi:FtsP/CotA-like multicopper oxidase with cupredoxin domain